MASFGLAGTPLGWNQAGGGFSDREGFDPFWKMCRQNISKGVSLLTVALFTHFSRPPLASNAKTSWRPERMGMAFRCRFG